MSEMPSSGAAVNPRRALERCQHRRFCPSTQRRHTLGNSRVHVPETSGQSADTLGGNHLTEPADHALVVNIGLELNASLDDVDRAHSTVGDTAADTTRQRALNWLHDTHNRHACLATYDACLLASVFLCPHAHAKVLLINYCHGCWSVSLSKTNTNSGVPARRLP